jgi:two-component system sensor histidine kinase YesM
MVSLANPISHVKESYRKLSIKKKVFFVFDILLITVSVLCFLLMQLTSSTYDRQLIENNSHLLDLYSSNIENETLKVNQMSLNILSNRIMQNNLPILNDSRTSTYEKAQAFNAISSYLQDQSFSEAYIASISIIDQNGDCRTIGNSTIDISGTMRANIMTRLQGSGGSLVWMGPQGADSDNDIIAARKVRMLSTLREIGTIIIRIDPQVLVDSLSTVSHPYNAQLAILSDTHQILYISKSINKANFLQLFIPEQASRIVTMQNGKYLMNSTVSNYTQWSYVYLLPYQDVFQNTIATRTVSVLFFLILLILINIIGLYFANSITKPIQKLSHKMKSVQHGQFDIAGIDLIPNENCDEVGQLSNDFIVMVQKINQLINENYVKQILAKESQLKTLQAQINPHFLYNTLDSIYWIAKTNRQHQIASMVQSLANLFRNSISSNQDIIPLKEELSFLSDYIMIQKIRFEDRLDFQLDVDEDLKTQNIPRLTLQPIVENSIKHSLEKMTGPCTIRVSSEKADNIFKIIISDNGNGIAPEKLSEINQAGKRGGGIGLVNIDERFKLYYGDDFGLTIDSGPGRGTSVILRLPYQAKWVPPDSALKEGASKNV